MSVLDDGKVDSHPSYGLLEIHRVSGGRTALFGSSIVHGQTIRLTVHRAKSRRSLAHTWYSQEGEIIEVEMSPAQFAEAITTLNCGQGVPCTIRRHVGEDIPEPVVPAVRQQYVDEFKAVMTELHRKITAGKGEVEELLKKKSLNNVDRARIYSTLDAIWRAVQDSVPFIHDSFNEAMDKTVTEAKAEVDAFFTNAVTTLGLQAMSSRLEALPSEPPKLLGLTDVRPNEQGDVDYDASDCVK
jgi:hypothetical protein